MYSVEFEDASYGGDWAEEIVIKYDGKEIARHRDKGEPEDALFCRDWDWVKTELLTAYNFGRMDGIIECTKNNNKVLYRTCESGEQACGH